MIVISNQSVHRTAYAAGDACRSVAIIARRYALGFFRQH